MLRRNDGRSGIPRAQTETVGVILLTAVIVVLIGGFSLVYLGTLDDGSGDGPVVDADIVATDENVTITHHGGESVPYADLEITIRGDSRSERHALTEWTEADDDTFDPSNRVRGEHAMGSGQLTVLLVDTASNTVVEEAYLDARGEQEGDDGTDSVRAAFTPNSTETEPGEAVAFDASDSTGEGGIASYEWDWNGDDSVDDCGEVVTHTFANPGTYTVGLTVTDADGNTDRTSRSINVGATPPTIDSTTLTDGDDDLVTSGDLVTVSATIESGSSDIDTVIADAGTFDAGEVNLTDGSGDGTYDATFEVGESATEGEEMVMIRVTNTVGNAVSAETDDAITVDTTPPDVASFIVTDESSMDWEFPWEYVESFQTQWSVTDPNLADTSVYLNRSETTEASYSGHSGDGLYENRRAWRFSGREHTVTLVAVDAAGNRMCRTVTDTADGTDPPDSAFEDC